MKWFKHYSGALQSESLADLLRDTGLQGYARYWILLEHLASIFDGESDSFRIPIETIRGLFRIRSWTELETFCERLATIRGLNIKRNGNVFEIKAPILLELQDRDFKNARNKRADVAPNIKIKDIDKDLDKDLDNIIPEKKIDEITSKNKRSKFVQNDLHEMICLWNEHCKNLPTVLKSNQSRDKKINSIWPELNRDEWIGVFKKINDSDFCQNKAPNSNGWKATFDWILQKESYLKVMEGKYDNRSKTNQKRFDSERNDKEWADEFNAIANGIDPKTGKPLG